MLPSTAPTPVFELDRLLKTVFNPRPGDRIALLIDLPDPQRVRDFAYLEDADVDVQRLAYEVFYMQLNSPRGILELEGGQIYAYRETGGSNLDLPETCVDVNGGELPLEEIYRENDILLCVSKYSATAPLTVFAHRFDFRAATLHGLNETILATGLAADYEVVDAEAELIRQGYTNAESVEIDFRMAGTTFTLKVELSGQEARKSSGVCRTREPDVVNLPSGEIYFMPTGAQGRFPMRYDDGTLAILDVDGGRIVDGELVRGNRSTLEAHLRRIDADPAYGTLGELGIGTQDLPFAGADIQDEKIVGTIHVATGRMDHLGPEGLGPGDFNSAANASHDDVLFAPNKFPEVDLPEVRMNFADSTEVIIRDYQPSQYVRSLLG